jgi:hypothetical protein
MTVMGIRWFNNCKYWIDRINSMDKLILDGYPHDEAHRIVKDYFLKHSEYTHLLIYGEDALFTPDHVKLLIEDAKEHDFQVVSGWTNINFKMSLSNVGMADLRKIPIVDYRQYKFIDIIDLINYKNNDIFIKCFYVGLPLTLIRRDVVEKVTFEPYTIKNVRIGKVYYKMGIMHDVRFAIDCANNNIPIYIDKRLFGLHYGDTSMLASDNPFKRLMIVQKATV